MTTVKKTGDQTLMISGDSAVALNNEDWYRSTTVSREFNFAARQVTTIAEFILWHKKSTTPGVSCSTSVTNFADIEGKEEIAFAHRQLRELGGKPPPLADVIDTGLQKGAKVLPGASHG
jgi:hypothetical protein